MAQTAQQLNKLDPSMDAEFELQYGNHALTVTGNPGPEATNTAIEGERPAHVETC
jgi:hypothetical protein